MITTVIATVLLTLTGLAADAQEGPPDQDLNLVGLGQETKHSDGKSLSTPRLPDGTVDLGGDGVWNLPWIREFSKIIVGAGEVPALPWTQAMHDYNVASNRAFDPEGFCLPPGGPRAFATPYPIVHGSLYAPGSAIALSSYLKVVGMSGVRFIWMADSIQKGMHSIQPILAILSVAGRVTR